MLAILIALFSVGALSVPMELATQDLLQPSWIWLGQDQTPINRFTYFRTKFDVLDESALSNGGTLRYSADSTAAVFLNGHVLRRRVTRFFEGDETAEVVPVAASLLKKTDNVLVVRHHNWGNVVTFQRTGQKQAKLWLNTTFGVQSDSTWKATIAKEFMQHSSQFQGFNPPGVTRVRFPLVINGSDMIVEDIHSSSYDDSQWSPVDVLSYKTPRDVETVGTGGAFIPVNHVIAQGSLQLMQDIKATDPYNAAMITETAKFVPAHVGGDASMPVSLKSGLLRSSKYITFGYDRPVHGYPLLVLDHCDEGTIIDISYLEVSRLQSTGEPLIDPSTGWLTSQKIVGKGYSDRYICREGGQTVEIADERTTRWTAITVHFPKALSVVQIASFGLFEDQQLVSQIGSFESGDAEFDQMVELSLIHAKITMSDVLVDCPGREDGQWIEDARLRANLASRWFGDHGLRQILARSQWESQYADYNTHPFAPSNFPAESTYDWSFAWSGTVFDHWAWTNDSHLVAAQLPALNRYWESLFDKLDVDSALWLSSNVNADIFVGSHCGAECSSGVVAPMIVQRLEQTAQLAAAVGDEMSAVAWKQFAAALRESFREYMVTAPYKGRPAVVYDAVSFQPTTKRFEGQGISQAGNTMAIYTNMLSHQEAQDAVNYLFPAPDGSPPEGISRWSNPTFLYRALTGITEAVGATRAIAHMKERFSQYLPLNPKNPTPVELQGPYGGPLPEYWVSREDLGLQPGQTCTTQPADASGSHGWNSVGLIWMHEKLLGVTQTPLYYGGDVSVAPNIGGLPYVKGKTVVAGAIITVFCSLRNQTYWLSYEPFGSAPLPAIHVFPPVECGPFAQLTLDNQQHNNMISLTQPGSYHFNIHNCSSIKD